MVQMVNFIFGLLWLFNGAMTIGDKRVKPSVARGIGVMFILVAVITMFIPPVENSGMLVCGISLLAPVLAIVIGLANTESRIKENKSLPLDEKMRDSNPQ
jgi:multisubunit Na+/H+ antiporter MnhG subunit